MAGLHKTCVILNPSAGNVRDLDEVVARLAQLPNAEIRLTNKPGSAARFAKTALRKGRELIVAAGGDGTLNEVINGIGEDLGDACVGLIPLGTGNDFARTLGVPTDVEAAIDLILDGRQRAVDLVRVTSDEVRYFVNVSAGGFSGLVDEKLTPEMKKTWGRWLICAGRPRRWQTCALTRRRSRSTIPNRSGSSFTMSSSRTAAT